MTFTPEAPAQSRTDARATEIIESNRKRKRVRKWIALCSIPLVLTAAVVSGKILSMYMFAHFTVTAHVSGDAEGTIRNAEWLSPLNWFEPFIATYDLGTGLAAGVKLEDARVRLEEALPLAVGSLQECAVRMNLTLVIEAQGDVKKEADDTEGARSFWLDALDALEQQPDTCNTPQADEASPDKDRSMKQTIEVTDARIREKLNPPEQDPPPSGGEDGKENQSDGPPPPPDDKIDQIEEQLEQGADEREGSGGGSGDQSGGGGGVEKPW